MRNFLLASVFALGVTHAAQASLIGDSVRAEYVGSASSSFTTPDPMIVGAGVEGNFFGNQFLDFGATTFEISSSSGFCGIFACSGAISLELTSLDLGLPITGVSFTSSLSGVSASFTDTSVTFSWNEQSLPTGVYLRAEFLTGPREVPAPAALGLFALGLGGLLVSAKKRRA
jgi:hypothetical protein